MKRFRQTRDFARTRIVAITGHADEGHKTLATKAGFDAVIFKPISLKGIKLALASAAPLSSLLETSPPVPESEGPGDRRRLPIGEARRIRNERQSKTLTQAEGEAAIREGIVCFREEYLVWRSEQVQAHFIKDFLVVRVHGVLTLAERHLSKSSPETGRDLIKQVRTELLELARPMLESLVHEIAGAKVSSMHHDLSTVTGEEVIIFSLTEAPRFGPPPPTPSNGVE